MFLRCVNCVTLYDASFKLFKILLRYLRYYNAQSSIVLLRYVRYNNAKNNANNAEG
jgi:hypothetical protein